MTAAHGSSRGPADQEARRSIHDVSLGLETQRTLLEQIRQLASSQGSLIESGQHDSLLALIQSRQDLVKQLDEVRSGMAPAMSRLQQEVDGLPDDIRADLRTRVNSVRELVGEIAAIDLDDTRMLEQHRTRCRTELEQVATAASAHAGYHAPGAPAARFTDARG
ncbi:MAG: hypothetical protein MK116_01315 [Phycisphaerales bacterium]|nr:hypothetical protein [Phycisphaerales bacterium]